MIGKKSTWLQILFWGFIWIFVPMLLVGFEHSERFFMRGLQNFIGIFIIVWINLELLLPNFYFRKKTTAYVFLSIALLLGIYFLLHFDVFPWSDFFDRAQARSRGRRSGFLAFRIVTEIIPMILSLIGSSLFAIAKFAANKEKEMAQLRSEKLEAEMKFLKSQINPHFLFNALNNVYTLSVLKSEKTPDHLLKISEMLRYMLYDCKADRVPLRKELEYIKNFVALNQLKDSKGLNVQLDLDESQPELMVAPLIFIPFIENAFKHSKIEDLEKGWIKIELKTKSKDLSFLVQNSLPQQPYTKDKTGGIGLQNVKRQLELIYPGRHQLDIDSREDTFSVKLNIQCQ